MRVYHQDQISVKFDDGVLFELDKERSICSSSRNRLINRSVIVYTKLCDLIRVYRLGLIDDKELARAIDKDILFQQSARHL